MEDTEVSILDTFDDALEVVERFHPDDISLMLTAIVAERMCYPLSEDNPIVPVPAEVVMAEVWVETHIGLEWVGTDPTKWKMDIAMRLRNKEQIPEGYGV